MTSRKARKKTTKKAKKKTPARPRRMLRRSHNRVIVKFTDGIGLPYKDGLESHLKEDSTWTAIATKHPGLTFRRLFHSVTPGEIAEVVAAATSANPDYRPPDFLTYFAIDNNGGVDREALVEDLVRWQKVQWAAPMATPQLPPSPALTTASLTSYQGYLEAAPQGIDAKHFWSLKGGTGKHARLVDIEWGWTLDHEDLPTPGKMALLSGENAGFFGHGTAVLGILSALKDSKGCTGIAHGVGSLGVVSEWRSLIEANAVDAIMSAIKGMDPGDILLLELQSNVGGWSEMPVEASKEVLDVIRLATEAQVVVVAAAGNGGWDLDTFKRDGKEVLNPSSPDFEDSGAILVGGAGSVNHEPKSTNRGGRIDCFAWANNVASTGDGGFGNLPDSYTLTFGGTSAAAAMVAGAAALVQSVAWVEHKKRYTPAEVRKILSAAANGTPSFGGPADKIGSMPDLLQIATVVQSTPPA